MENAQASAMSRDQLNELLKQYLTTNRNATNAELDKMVRQQGLAPVWTDYAKIRRSLGIYKAGPHLATTPFTRTAPSRAAMPTRKEKSRSVSKATRRKVINLRETQESMKQGNTLPAEHPMAKAIEAFKRALAEHGFTHADVNVSGDSWFTPKVNPVRYP
jgi:hypothetical protein